MSLEKTREINQSERAHQFFYESLKIAQAQGDKRSEAHAFLALADNALHYCPENDTNAWDCREWYSRRSLEVFKEIGDRERIADSLVMLAGQVEYQETIRLLEESIAISREVGYAKGMVMGLVRLGLNMGLNGDREHGCQLVRDALKIAQEKETKRMMADVLCSLGILADNGAERLTSFEESIALYRELGLQYRLAETLFKAALLLQWEKRSFKCEEALLEALTIYRKLDDAHGESLCLHQLANIARKRGDNTRATVLDAQRSVDTTSQVPPTSEMEKLMNTDRDGKLDLTKRWFG